MPSVGGTGAGTAPSCSTPDRRRGRVGTTGLQFTVIQKNTGLLTFYLAAPRFEAVQEGCLPCIRFWFLHALRRFLRNGDRCSFSSAVPRPKQNKNTSTILVSSFLFQVVDIRTLPVSLFYLTRLTPPYLLVVFIYAGLFLHLYDGPLFPQRIDLTDVNYCRQHWWIIYFSNFFYTKEQADRTAAPSDITDRLQEIGCPVSLTRSQLGRILTSVSRPSEKVVGTVVTPHKAGTSENKQPENCTPESAGINKPSRNACEYQALVKDSAMMVHALDTTNRIDVESVEVLDRELRFTPQRRTAWSAEIIMHHSMNGIEGMGLTSCLPWTWYLANEFQFSVFLAPVFITVMKWTSYESLLVKPYTHLGTYTMGLLLGWILLQRKQQGMLRRNSRREQLCVGSLLALVFAFCLSGLYGATNTSEPHSLSKFTSVLFTALSRPAFALEVAIVIYLCATDNAPHINGLLSWSGFRLLSQLTYGLFLIHPIYVHLILLRSQTPITLSSATLVLLFLAVSVLSFISSFFLFLVTETPVRTVEQFYGRRWKNCCRM
ncbi:Nose resistant to fluoxetine protein 6 [Clonorchis sinensis]|uniref:Nose resistant to fluoxetine protein 6 n=1 Tax=Clonorchis sinensis TaxID=79923 RepID=A0A3R7EUC0_CLOSI|nr:Nose resistant to fluoxetine protein 6 [Clonorchis sinensis]